jgi:putative holliday junction resolvase
VSASEPSAGPRAGRVLALDLGTRRIGVALSDPTGTIASPLETLAVTGPRRAAEQVVELCRRYEVTVVVVGWPRNMDGSAGPAAKDAEAFAARLRPAVGVPVELWDERLSTAAAERTLIDADVRREDRRGARDRVAAALILRGYLDARRRGLAQDGPGHNLERR